MLKLFLPFLLLITLFSTILRAQTAEDSSFTADRPGYCTGPATMGYKGLQIENGASYTTFTDGNLRIGNYLFSSLLLRYGLFKTAELRVQADYVYHTETDDTGSFVVSGVSPITIGTKVRLCEQRKIIPAVSLLLNLTLPVAGNEALNIKNPAPSFYLLLAHKLSDRLSLCYNYGLMWDGFLPDPVHFYALDLGISLADKWSLSVEGYGLSSPRTSSDFYMDLGLIWMINYHLQADFSLTANLNSISDYFQVNGGIVWKVPLWKMRNRNGRQVHGS